MPKIFFVHIPKTGGTTLDWGCLQRAYGPADRFCETDAFPGGRNIYAEVRRKSEGEHVPFCHVWAQHVATGLIPDVTLYAGHMAHGAHLAWDSPYQYITVIRNPVDRLRSLLDLQASFGIKRTPLELVSGECKDYDNWQVRCLCHGGWTASNVTPGMLDEAKGTLAGMLYGITDRLDDFARQLCERFGWPMPPHRLNKTVPGEPVKCYPEFSYRKADITPEVIDVINDRNKYDWELYWFASGDK